MSFLNKNKGGYLGYFRYSTPEIASGVWNLKQQQQESSNFEWYAQHIFENDGLTGWNNSGASISPGGSIQVSAVGQVAYINPMPANQTMLYVTVVCEMYLPNNNAVALHFCNSSSGQGPFLKIETRDNFNSGLMYGTAFGAFGGEPIQGIEVKANQWNKVAVRIPSSADASWYINGVYRDVEVILKNGNNIAIRKFAGTDMCFVRNVRVYRGPV